MAGVRSAATPGMIQVEGLTKLDRALKELDPAVRAELRVALRAAAEPVRDKAARLTFYGISGMRRAKNSAWWTMRLGGGVYVYLAPGSRNRGGSPRPNLARLLMDKGMRPGLALEEPEIVGEVGYALDRAVRAVGL